MRILKIPIIPNSPKNRKSLQDRTGKLLLRINRNNNLVENKYFSQKKILYDINYQNNQSNSLVFQNHMFKMINLLKKNFKKGSKLVEIGCGKGDFFEKLSKEKYFDCIGFDKTYEGKNKKIYKRYLNSKDKINADIVVIRHVLEHIKRPHEFLSLLFKVFGNSYIFIEVPDYKWIKDNNAFYDITYEHVNYFTKNSLSSLFDDKFIKRGTCFNNQYQYLLTNLKYLSNKFKKQYESKNWKDINFDKLFFKLEKKINELEEKAENSKNIYVWGAATKGCMFIIHCLKKKNFFFKIKFAIDINKEKINKFLPISNIKIISKKLFLKKINDQDFLIISNPNYKNEIIKFLKKNTKKKLIIESL